MSHDRGEKNKAIAEWLEPSDSLGMPTVIVTDEIKPSPLNAWFADARYEEGDEAKWYPRDFYTDEVANALVLEKLIQLHDTFYMEFHRKVGKWEIEGISLIKPIGTNLYWCDVADRKTAICEAALALIESHQERG